MRQEIKKEFKVDDFKKSCEKTSNCISCPLENYKQMCEVARYYRNMPFNDVFKEFRSRLKTKEMNLENGKNELKRFEDDVFRSFLYYDE